MRDGRSLRALWAAGGTAIGLWSVSSDPEVVATLAAEPFDYVVLDLQHGASTLADLPVLVRAVRAAGVAPLVRASWNDPAVLMRVLDCGASGVFVPMVDDPAAAARAVSACRYPPRGTRSWGPVVEPQQPDDANAAVLCLPMIETAAGFAAVSDIAAVPGLDGLYVGPADLALSHGFGRASYRDQPQLVAMIEQVVSACAGAGVVAGLHCSDLGMAVEFAARGLRMVTPGTDLPLLRAACHALAVELGRAP